MSQYKAGTVAVTNASAAVVGTGTLWASNVAAGQTFIIQGSTVPYIIGVVTDDTHITLASAYAGSTQSGLSYEINTSRTPVLLIDYMEQGDVDTATTFKRAMLQIEALLIKAGPGGLFRKVDPTTAAFVKTGAFGISTQAAAIYVEVNGVILTIAGSTAVTMPSPTTGTDYAIWAKTDGTLEATSNHVTPPTANARRIGGFHYAPGGNATGVAGGDATPAINAYSIWDLKFRPACPDPRGMTLVADGFWADIYLLGVDHPTNGSSKYNVTIADGSSPPKIPAKFGGNGSTAYGGGNWWDMGEVLRSFGKRHPTYDEFAALAYGVLENYSVNADPGTTGLVNGSGSGAGINTNAYKYTSKWGVIQATGTMYVWGANLGGPYNTTAAWQNDNGGRGQTYNLPNAVLLGASWSNGVYSGSRYSGWDGAPSFSSLNIGARGVCDHLQLD